MRTLKLLAGVIRDAALLGLIGIGGSTLPANAQAPANPGAPPNTILFDGASLERLRQQADPVILHTARAEADKTMQDRLISIMDEKALPPSGDKHDYMSLAPYWWPNPATPNHLPYIRKDGQHNPEATAVQDHALLSHMEANVHVLALAYFLTGDQRYAYRAALQLRTWFLDPATRMNPNLRYAQAIRGVNEGRGTGILDAQGLADVVDALALLARSPSWSAADEAAMHAWFEAYFAWLTTSANGRDESTAKNNHGSWYDEQAVAIALYLGKTDYARSVADAAKTRRIAEQIQADGQQPLEEARTRSFHYSIYNIEALMKLAIESQTINVDLWNYKAPDGGSIRVALDYLVPFAEKQKTWQHQELDGVSATPLRDPLLIAAVHYNNAAYEAAALSERHNDLSTLLWQRQFAELQRVPR